MTFVLPSSYDQEMTFESILKQAWSEHATNTPVAIEQLPQAAQLISTGAQIPLLSQLVTHIFGEHLGQWDRGVSFLHDLKSQTEPLSNSESNLAIARSVASLELAAGKKESLAEFSTSDQIRILCVTAASLCTQNQTEGADRFFKSALSLASSPLGLAPQDPAARSLAVTGNSIACNLEEKLERTPTETTLMILAAQTSRTYWQVAGTWLEVERAEYRLARAYLQAQDFERARIHADRCLALVQENRAPALELFYGFEASALVEKARHNASTYAAALYGARDAFKKLGPDDQAACHEALTELEKSPA